MTLRGIGAGVIAMQLLASGCHAGVGPVIAVNTAKNRGLAMGWEGGGGWGLVHGNVGQTWRRELLSFAAFEPGVFLGWTVGVSHGTTSGSGFAEGFWAGAGRIPSCPEGRKSERLFTAAIGWRRLSGTSQVYFAPKVSTIQCVSQH